MQVRKSRRRWKPMTVRVAVVAGLASLPVCGHDEGPIAPQGRGPVSTSLSAAGPRLARVPVRPEMGTTEITLKPKAHLREGGTVVRVRGKVACNPVGGATAPLEAFVTLSQDDGAVFGEGFLRALECDGRLQPYQVDVTTFDGAFHRGEGFASAFILVCDEEGSECEQGQESRTLRIHGPS